MLRSFFANLDLGLRKASPTAKMRFLSACILPIARARWSRWPYQATYADRLDRMQRKMLSCLFGIRPREDEPIDAFQERRRQESSAMARGMGLWSSEWARSVCNWASHVDRDHDPFTWSKPLLGWRDSNWLFLRRLMNSAINESRTRTRAGRGKIHRRWADGLDIAKTRC